MNIVRTSDNAKRASKRYRGTLLLGCTALVALAPTFVFAQEADATTANAGSGTALAPIVIKGSRTVLDTSNDSKTIVATETTGAGKLPTDILTAPATVSVITSKELEERRATSIVEAVRYTAGVTTGYYGGDDRYDYINIRGFEPYTYRDGLAIGRTVANTKEEPYAFDRVEVLKGTSSAGFGAAEPGGSINYVTKLPKTERFGEAYVTGGSYNHKEAGLDFGDNITKDDTLSYRLTTKMQNADAEYDYSRDNEKFIMGGLTWRPTDVTSLSFVFDHLSKEGVPGSGGQPIGSDFDRSDFFGEPDYYFMNTNRNTYSVKFDHDFGNGLSFSSNSRYTKGRNNFGSAYLSYTRTDGSDLADRYYFGSDTNNEQFVTDANLVYETNFGNVDSRTLGGLEYNHFQSQNYGLYDPSAPPINWVDPVYSGGPASADPNYGTRDKQKTKAIYLQQDFTFDDRLTVSVGMRNDWFDLTETDLFGGGTESDSNSKFTKRIGVSYKITDELAPYISYAESAAPPGVGTDPTTGKQYEVGIKYRPDAFPALFTASLYDLTKGNITVDDGISYIPFTVNKVRHRGLELEAKAEVTKDINLIAAYNYIDSKIDDPGEDDNGNRLMRVPKNMASLWGTYKLEGQGRRGDMTFGAGARYIGSYYYDLANSNKSETAVVFDASFTYNIVKNTTFQLNVNNVFDDKHITNQDGGGVYYNQGRTIYATLRQTW
ncbi:TonB-dependent siderophore receptor [Neorhizobium sp. NCHU2750]|uniref:TonB-dependent siderophore receptor n=1 Tax=Neorhizobium sp. NCHU2750 TaxID=1825976 RepID=UPI000E733347|nr:iron complex outermembrane recepter protein [Neorhizobium sp. NCHU2750]